MNYLNFSPHGFSDAVVNALTQQDSFRTAVELARQGFPVLPICCIEENGECACGDLNCRAPGKHPFSRLTPHGIHDATSDFETVRDWFALYQPMNIGLCMGNGLVTLDLDPRANIDLQDTFGLPKTNTEITGGNGEHRFYREPRGMTMRSRKARGLPEIKSRGSYVVVAPGNHASGGRYINPNPALPFASIPRDWPLLRDTAVETRLLRKLESVSDPLPMHYREAQEVWASMIIGRHAENLLLLHEGRWAEVMDNADEPRYPSQSEADASFLFAATVFTDNPRVLDALMRESGLVREKWFVRRDYRAIQIAFAIEGRRWKSTSVLEEVRMVIDAPRLGVRPVADDSRDTNVHSSEQHAPPHPRVPKEDVLDRTLLSSDPRRRVRDALIRDVIQFGLVPPISFDRGDGWVRLPVELVASIRKVSPKSVQRAVLEAENRGFIEADVFRFEFHGTPRCDRLIRVTPQVFDKETS